MIASRERSNQKTDTGRLFKEWVSCFSEKIFVIIKVYADESGTQNVTGQVKGSEVPVVAGFIASADYWIKFRDEWQAVLNKYNAPYFHNRELGKKSRLSSKNKFCKWDEDRVTDFRYDLAMVAGSVAIPIGGLYHAKKHHELGFKGDPFETVFKLFFNDFCEAMNAHKLGFAEKVLFIFDNGNSKKWREQLHGVYDIFREKNPTFGGLTFEDDRDPLHLGLQAADLYASATRQRGLPHMESGNQPQPMRILDYVLNRNLREKGHPWNYSQMHPLVFKLITDLFRMDERKQKREWAARGLRNKEYDPYEHFPFEKFGIKK